jgi:hypothetical protein
LARADHDVPHSLTVGPLLNGSAPRSRIIPAERTRVDIKSH